jgi:lipoate-protein ligase A
MHQNPHPTIARDHHDLAGDWALFDAVESGAADHLYRCWHNPAPIVVAGRFRPLADDVNVEACGADQVPIVRRSSGGGTVVLGDGCLNYAVALSLVSRPPLHDVAMSFAVILGAIVEALGVPGLAIAGTDLSLGGRKVSGNAQQRGRRALLHHGTLLFAFDPALASRYLKEPPRQPAYRRSRPHADFLGNLPLAGPELRVRLEQGLRAAVRPPAIGGRSPRLQAGAYLPSS